MFERGFAGGVEGRVASEDGAGADRGEVDDAAAVADGGEDGLDVEERAEDVGVEHFVEDGGGEGAHGVERGDARVVDLRGDVSGGGFLWEGEFGCRGYQDVDAVG